MKILRVSGENLASLARFDVDFESGPLKAAALFAIAGPTGAGKSTLLDAICLALYGQTPRSARGGSEKIQVAPGREWTTKDQRNFVRRGAGSASARVLFQVGGERYVAAWKVATSTSHTGELSLGKPALKLCRAAPGGGEGESLASGVTEHTDEVKQLTGLGFQNFCRSVLLAQGEFSAFLDAKTDERAEVLEALTDPQGLYRKLSLAAHERGSQAKETLRKKREEVERVTVLPPEEVARLQQEVVSRQQQVAERMVEGDVLRGAVARWGELAEARRREAEHVLAVARAEEALAAQAPAEQVLAEAESVRMLREPFALRAAAQRQVGAEQAVLDGLAGKLGQAQAEEQAAQQSVEAARGQLADEERRAAEGQAVRGQALGVQGELNATGRQLDEVRNQVAGLQQGLEQAESALQQTRNQLAGVAVKRGEHHQWLQANPEAELLAEDPESWRGHLRRWVEEARTLAEEQPQLDRAERARATEAEAVREATAAHGAAVDKAGQAAEALKAAEARREALGPAVSLEQAQGLQRRKADLAELARLGSEGLERRSKAREAAASAARERAAESAAGAREGQLREELSRRKQAEQACVEAQAAARARAELEERRKHLVDGEECPLCGSLEHPFAAGVEAGVDAAEVALRAAAAAVAEAQAGLERAGRERATAAGRAEGFEREAASKQAEWAALSARWRAAAAAFPELPAALDGEALPEALRVLTEALEREAAAQAAAEQRRKEAEAEVTALRTAEQAASGALRRADEALQRARELLHRAELEWGQLARAVEDRKGRMEAGLAQAEVGLLKVPQARRRFLQDPEGQLAAWDKLVSGYAARQQQLRELDLAEAQGLTRKREQEERLEAVRLQQAAAAGKVAGLEARAAELEERVRSLLGGLSLSAHESREKQRLASARSACDMADARFSVARDAVANLQGAQTRSEAALEAAVEEHAARAEALGRALTEARLDEAEAVRRLAHPDEVLAAMKAELEAARDAVARARGVLAEARAALARLEAERPEQALEDLQRELQACEARIREASEALGAARAKLSQDEADRVRRAALEREYELLAEKEGTWGELCELIGSHDGKAFAQFAQGLNFRSVLAAANRELGQLRSRYQLTRLSEGGGDPLSLAVRDATFGGELRPLNTLSGGEKFLSSLSLALGLSARASRNRPIETLFIDEGFGTLDKKTLDEAMAALKALQGRGTQVGIISHVENVKDYVQATVRVRPVEEGLSEVGVEG
ncbi:MAG: AAA family ATPase [Deltaproteobacteria bacterium]|nr:AAA family ATPase [Deltaproteobacteria bacterium]